jgi:hypothetical protein
MPSQTQQYPISPNGPINPIKTSSLILNAGNTGITHLGMRHFAKANMKNVMEVHLSIAA